MELEHLYEFLSSAHIEAQGIVDTIDEPILLLSSDLRVLRANPAFLRVFHLEEAVIVGASLIELGNGLQPLRLCYQACAH